MSLLAHGPLVCTIGRAQVTISIIPRMSLAARAPCDAAVVVGLPSVYTRAAPDAPAAPAVVELQPARLGVTPWILCDRVVAAPCDTPYHVDGVQRVVRSAGAIADVVSPWESRVAAAAAAAGAHDTDGPCPALPPALIIGVSTTHAGALSAAGRDLIASTLVRLAACGHTLSTCAIVVYGVPAYASAARERAAIADINTTVRAVFPATVAAENAAKRKEAKKAPSVIAADCAGPVENIGNHCPDGDVVADTASEPDEDDTAVSAAFDLGTATAGNVFFVCAGATEHVAGGVIMDAVDCAADARRQCRDPGPPAAAGAGKAKATAVQPGAAERVSDG